VQPRPLARRALRGALTAALAAVALGSCSGGTEPARQTLPPGPSGTGTTVATSHGSGTTERAPTGSATIATFEVRNQISCAGAVDVTTGVTYITEGASRVAFLVDGTQVPGSPPPSGSFDVPISCDGRAHTVVLAAVDADGGTTVDSRVVLTITTPQGD
jgi:hypothetical protein